MDCVKINITKQSYMTMIQEGFRRQAPTGIDILGRVLHLKQLDEDGELMKKEDASKIVANVLSQLWIHGLNTYPMNEKT